GGDCVSGADHRRAFLLAEDLAEDALHRGHLPGSTDRGRQLCGNAIGIARDRHEVRRDTVVEGARLEEIAHSGKAPQSLISGPRIEAVDVLVLPLLFHTEAESQGEVARSAPGVLAEEAVLALPVAIDGRSGGVLLRLLIQRELLRNRRDASG